MNNLTAQVVLRVLAGLAGAAVALCSITAWHYWHIDGFLAFIFVLVGLGICCSALDPDTLLQSKK